MAICRSERRSEVKELIYHSTYHAMKAGPCRVGVCKHDGKCWLCEEYGLLRSYAARDTDRIHELRALVGEMADELSKFHAWEETRALVAKAREVIGTISQPDRGARSNAETTEAIDPTHSAVRKG